MTVRSYVLLAVAVVLIAACGGHASSPPSHPCGVPELVQSI
jgi:hypothetical protein